MVHQFRKTVLSLLQQHVPTSRFNAPPKATRVLIYPFSYPTRQQYPCPSLQSAQNGRRKKAPSEPSIYDKIKLSLTHTPSNTPR